MHLLVLCLYNILLPLHPDRKAKVRKRTIQVGIDARTSFPGKKEIRILLIQQEQKDPSKHGDVWLLDRMNTFCLAACLDGGDLLFACQVAQCSS